MKEKRLKFRINDDVWTFNIVSKEQMKTKHGEPSQGVTEIKSRTVDLRCDKLSKSLLLHELFHVHMTYTFVDAADLTVNSFEDICADLFAVRGTLMQRQAAQILKRLA